MKRLNNTSPGFFPNTNLVDAPLIILSPASPATLIVAKSAAILLDSNYSASSLRAFATTSIASASPSAANFTAFDSASALIFILSAWALDASASPYAFTFNAVAYASALIFKVYASASAAFASPYAFSFKASAYA